MVANPCYSMDVGVGKIVNNIAHPCAQQNTHVIKEFGYG